jgi:hypothetical protein
VKRRPFRRKAAAPAPRYLTARRVATYPVTKSPAIPTRTRSTGQWYEWCSQLAANVTVALTPLVQMAGRCPFFHAVHTTSTPPTKKHRNHAVCSNMTRFNIRVAFAMTSLGVGKTSLPMTDLPSVAPLTKLRR